MGIVNNRSTGYHDVDVAASVLTGAHIVVHLRCLCTDSHHQNILSAELECFVSTAAYGCYKEGLV